VSLSHVDSKVIVNVADLSPRAPKKALNQILGVLAADPSVEAVYIGGSVARGDCDEVSDIDLWIEGKDWAPESIGGLLLTGQRFQIGGFPFLHGVALDGTIIDVLYGGQVAWDGYLRLDPPSPTPLDPAPIPPFTLLDEFWLTSLKHRKALFRGLDPILTIGLQHDRGYLLRAWALHATGVDPGPQAFNFFSLRDLFRDYVDTRCQQLLGLPLRDRGEIVYAVHTYRDEMSRLFPNPTPLESVVRSLPLFAL